MTNSKSLLIVFGTVLVVAGIAIYLLTNNPFSPGPAPTPVPPGGDTIKKTFTKVPIKPSNKHVEELNDRIVALEAAEWSTTNLERLESDLNAKQHAGLITEDIAESLRGNLFNAYLITVKEAALKVIKSSSSLRDLYPSHSELKRLRGSVVDGRVTEVTNMTYAIYGIPYYQEKFEEQIAAGGLTDEDLKRAAQEVAKKIEALPDRFDLFKRSPLVKAVCEEGTAKLGRTWGAAIIARSDSKVEEYVVREQYDEARSAQYKDELTGYTKSKYLSGNERFSLWASKLKELLENHRKADRRFEIGRPVGGASDCSPYEGFEYYLNKCKASLNTGTSSDS